MVAFNWDRHWDEEEESEGARQFALRFAEMLAGFMEENRILSVADARARRFAALLAERNLTSQRRIGEALGVRPRRFYSSKRHNVYALVRKIK